MDQNLFSFELVLNKMFLSINIGTLKVDKVVMSVMQNLWSCMVHVFC